MTEKSNSKEILAIVFKFIIVVALVLIFGLCLFAGIMFARFRPEVETFKDDLDKQIAGIQNNNFEYFKETEIYDKNQNLIGKVSTNSYEYVKLPDAGVNIVKGYVAVEDRNFYLHNGVDYKGILRAAASLVKNRGKITQGGSTITQQVLKNNVIGRNENKYGRKIKEIMLAGKFEDSLGKDKIMEIYLNTNPYGNQCFGVQAASKYYFGKPVKDLDMHQVAFLVGLSNAPTAYNPKTNPQKSEEKTNQVLGVFLEQKLIDQAEYDKMIKEDLKFAYARAENALTNPIVNLSLKEAAESIIKSKGINIEEMNSTVDGRKDYDLLYNSYLDLLKTGGYKIYTSIDTTTQAKLQEVLSNSLKGYTKKSEDGKYALQGAAVLVNNKTGMVESVIGSRDPQDQFNRGILSYRQPGSAIKPLAVYAPAMENGEYFPSREVVDKEISITSGGKTFKPKNAYRGFRGKMPLREALARSTNTIAYQVMEDITPQKSSEYLDKLHWKKITEEDRLNLSLALGGMKYGVTPMELAKGFSTLANNGIYYDNGIILRIEYQFNDLDKLSKVAEIAVKNEIEDITKVLNKYARNSNKQKDDKATADNIFNTKGTKEEEIMDINSLNVVTINPKTGGLDEETIKRISTQVYNPATAYMTLSMMEDSATKPYGTSNRARVKSGIELAGKTGTTNDQKDAWFAGVTPDYTLCVWIGYDQPKSLGFYGSDKPVQMWNSMMKSISDKLVTKEFTKPESVGLRFIDSSGYPVDSKTGDKDLFNLKLLDQQKALKKKLEEERIQKEKEKFAKELPGKVDEFISKLNIDESSSYDPQKLINEYNKLKDDIDKLEDSELRSQQMSKLLDNWSGVEIMINNKKKELEQQKIAEKEKAYINDINKLENRVNSGSLDKESAQAEFDKLYRKVSSMTDEALKKEYLYKLDMLKDIINLIPDKNRVDFGDLEYNVTNSAESENQNDEDKSLTVDEEDSSV